MSKLPKNKCEGETEGGEETGEAEVGAGRRRVEAHASQRKGGGKKGWGEEKRLDRGEGKGEGTRRLRCDVIGITKIIKKKTEHVNSYTI